MIEAGRVPTTLICSYCSWMHTREIPARIARRYLLCEHCGELSLVGLEGETRQLTEEEHAALPSDVLQRSANQKASHVRLKAAVATLAAAGSIRDNRAIFEERIAPLVEQIQAVCRENEVPYLASFQLTGRLTEPSGRDVTYFKTSAMVPEKADASLRIAATVIFAEGPVSLIAVPGGAG